MSTIYPQPLSPGFDIGLLPHRSIPVLCLEPELPRYQAAHSSWYSHTYVFTSLPWLSADTTQRQQGIHLRNVQLVNALYTCWKMKH